MATAVVPAGVGLDSEARGLSAGSEAADPEEDCAHGSRHPVGSEAWRTDLSDVILPLYVDSSSESEGEGRGDDVDGMVLCPAVDTSDDENTQEAHASRPPTQPKKVQPWEEIPPQRVLELMNAHEKHGHSRRGLYKQPRPEPVPTVPSIRRISAEVAAQDLAKIVGGHVAGDIGEPVIVLGLAEGWRAQDRWCSAQAFAEHYGDMPLKVHEMVPVGGMGKGTELWLPARDYIEYAQSAEVDAPFYVFQKKFIEGVHDDLFADYERPPLFSDDLWDLTPKLRSGFEQNKFFCLGGERTGSALHVDPHFTGAWNTLLCGEKRWVLFPPEMKMEDMGVPTDLREKLLTPCSHWWLDSYPRLASPGGAGERLGMREVIQRAGETIFVPAGWWHTVLNHGWTIAVTENMLSPQTLARTWPMLSPDRRRSACLARAIRRLRPELLAVLRAGGEASGDEGSTTGSEHDKDDSDFRMY